MTAFKICGLREVGHAVIAAEAGADFLGFVFVPGVPRQVSRQHVKEVIQEYRRLRGPNGPRLVGLFANQPVEEVNETVAFCGLDMAQLCGDEDAGYWRQVAAPVIRQVKVINRGSQERTVEDVLGRVEAVVSAGGTAVLDSYEPRALGGTGRTFDWTVARSVAGTHDLLLAGGLTSENVGEAISMVRPWGVDVSSGVETDGAKDPKKIVDFAEAVRRADG